MPLRRPLLQAQLRAAVRRSSTFARAAGGLAVALSVATAARAQIFNGGIPSGYTCTGTCGTSAANGVVTLAPGGGSQFGWVSTNNAPTQNPLGINGTVNGSTLLSNVFTTTAGQPLSFDFNFITSDGSEFSDYAYVRLINTTTSSPTTLFTARTRPVGSGNTVPGFGLPGIAPGVTLTPATTPIIPGGPAFDPLGTDSGACYNGPTQGCGYTGWIGASYLVPTAGTYQLEFGVFNFTDDAFQSALAFDFASGQGGTPTQPGMGTVPEPSTYALLGFGLAAVGMAARRRRTT